MVGVPGLEPGTNRLCVPLQFSLPFSCLWSGLSLYPRFCTWIPAIQSLHLIAHLQAILARDYQSLNRG